MDIRSKHLSSEDRGVILAEHNRGSNGLLRQFMPKGNDLNGASQTWLNDVANLMNNRPRKTLGWRTPTEAMADEIAAFKSTVALDV
jgi:IS30 family transposase